VGNLSPRPLTFNAHYGLFRCLLGMFGLLSLLSVGGLAWALARHPDRAAAFGAMTVVFGASGWISYARCKKRSEDFAQCVYDLFVAGVADKPASGDRT
jgi:hypothetical protein